MVYLQKIHKLLRRYRYFYYEMDESLVTDYQYDMLEIEYTKLCDEHNIKQEGRITNFVGFDIKIPMRLYKT